MNLMYCGVCPFEDICVYDFPCLIESFQSIFIIVYVLAPIYFVFVINDFVSIFFSTFCFYGFVRDVVCHIMKPNV